MVKDHSLPIHSSPNEKDADFVMSFVKIPYGEIYSKWVVSRLSKLIKRQFGINLRILFDTFAVYRYFQLNSKAPHALFKCRVSIYTVA